MEDLKALAILNLVDFRYKAKNIKNTNYGKTLNAYKYMINDNFSICYIIHLTSLVLLLFFSFIVT